MDHLAQYRLAFDITPLPLVLVDPLGKVLLANDPFCTLFGYTVNELLMQTVEALMPAENRENHPQQRSAFFRVPTKRAMGTGRDLVGVTKCGQEIPLELAIEPVPVGEQTCAMLTAVDIRERKKREEQLRQALDATASGMVLSDAHGKIVLVNQAASDLLGYSVSELIGAPISKLVPGKSQIAHDVLMKNAMRGRLQRHMADARIVHARRMDGAKIPVDISLTQIDTPEGWMVMSTITDLRAQIAFEEALREKNALLAALNDELSQFAYSASHDLKAPLVSVIGLLRLCLEDMADENTADLAANLTRALDISERSASQVEGILELARAGKDRIERKQIDLRKLVENLWDNLTGADKDATLNLNVASDMRLETEEITLKVILDNLLSNALKYGDTAKRPLEVTLDAQRAATGVTIKVSDNGSGIAPEHLDKIFDIFKRFDSRSGSGLGLALVHKHVTRLGGQVTVESPPGQGTCMSFSIPDLPKDAP